MGSDGQLVHGVVVRNNVSGDAELNIKDGNSITASADAIRFEGTVDNATVKITNNGTLFSDDDDGVDFTKDIINGSAVEVSGNALIDGGSSNGIEFARVRSGSTVKVENNNIDSEDNGIFATSADGGATLDIHGNTIQANLDDRIHGSGIWFSRVIGDATINIGKAGSANTISVNPNLDVGGSADLDGIHFDAGAGAGADINIDSNNIGSPSAVSGNGIEFNGVVDGADIEIANNEIDSGENAVQFTTDVIGESLVKIANNDIGSTGGNGVAFLGKTSNSRFRHGEEILIEGNTIVGRLNGISFAGEASDGKHDIVIRNNVKVEGQSGHGIVHTGGISDAELWITDNTQIKGNVDGVHVAGDLKYSSRVDVTGNKDIQGVRDDGVQVTDTATRGGVDVNINNNTNIHDVGNNGVEIRNLNGAEIAGNTITRARWDGINVIGTGTTQVTGNTITDTLRASGVAVLHSTDANVDNNDITNSARLGVYVGNGDRITINNNRINNSGTEAGRNWSGVHIENTDSATVTANTIKGTTLDGINIGAPINFGITGNTGKFTIDGNTIDNTGRHGINVISTDNTDVLNNKIGTNGAAGNINGDGVLLQTSHGSNIKGNTITKTDSPSNSFGNGIQILNSNNVTVGGDGLEKNIITDVDWDGIRVVNADNINIRKNEITDAQRTGIYGNNLTNSKIVRNKINGTNSHHGIHLKNGDTVSVHRNKVDNVKKHGIVTDGTAGLRVTKNNVDTTGWDGIHVKSSHGAVVNKNKVGTDGGAGNIGQDGIHINGSNNAIVQGNTVNNAQANGILVNPSDNATIGGPTENEGNTIADVGRHGIYVTGGTGHNIRHNTIRRAGWDGVTVRNFGNAWIAYNDIKWTGDDGIHAENGDFVSIYNNYVDLSGYLPKVPFGNKEVGKDANGIYVEDIKGGDLPELSDSEGFGFSLYGASVEVYGNDVANSEDDGIQVKKSDSTYIADNIIGHVGDDGVDVDRVGHTVVSDNAITLAGDKGITIDGGKEDGYYAGVFDNRVLLTGNDGIQVENIRSRHDEKTKLFGDKRYGYGWAVNVSGNEVAMTGTDGIEVRNSDATKVAHNDVFMAGMGKGLTQAIHQINAFANGTFIPAPATLQLVTEDYDNSFEWNWGDGHGINVHGIDGAYYSPNGWAADIRGNDVQYTGGHGILAEDNDRTRIKNNDVAYAGIDYTTFHGAHSMLEALNSGPFHSPGRRDLWRSAGESLIDVLSGYFGVEPGHDHGYISIENIGFDAHDGIHAEDIYNDYGNGLFALKIKGNEVHVTGDDGIEVDGAGRTLIAKNIISDAGYGALDPQEEHEDYGSGDYYGADGIHVRNVSTEIYGRRFGGGLTQNEDGSYNYERPRNYALIIRNNDVRRTADDGIEVVGNGRELQDTNFSAQGAGEGSKDPYHYYGHTDRVLIAGNTVRKAGYFDNKADVQKPGLDHGYENVGEDGYGHDGIHVRNIGGTVLERIVLTETQAGAGSAGGDGFGFYGYAVDIIDNDVRKTGDDGIEVFNSESTLIAGNTVRKAGVYDQRRKEKRRSRGGSNTDGADYYGADGIHVRNVGGADPYYGTDGFSGPGGFQPYSVAIVDNDVRKTADDGIEVVGEALENPEWDILSVLDGWDEDVYQYDGTGRTLILGNVTRDNGVSGHYGSTENSSYDSRSGSSSYHYNEYGNRGSYDGYGGDGIHVRGVGAVNNGGSQWDMTAAAGSVAGGILLGGDYAVQIIGNDVRRTGDDGIEVIGNANLPGSKFGAQGVGQGPKNGFGRVLVAANFVKKAGLSGGSYNGSNSSYNGQDEGGYYNGYSYSDNYSYYGNAGQDGYGADGIHVRGVGGYDDGWNPGSAGKRGGYYGYAVDVVGNIVRRTGDDGIEVRDSSSTFIAYNDVKNAGMLSHGSSDHSSSSSHSGPNYSSSSYNNRYWNGSNGRKGSYTGGDGIHVENVGTNGPIGMGAFAAGIGAGDGFNQYAVVIFDNTVDNSADDGIEVLHSGRTRIQKNDVTDSGLASFSGYSSSSGSYFSSSRNGYDYTNGASAHDGRGSDGIHVGNVHLNEGDNYRYRRTDAVEIIGNTVDSSADDGIQVEESGDTLIRRNIVSNSGIGTYHSTGNGGPLPTVLATTSDDGGSYYNHHSYNGTGGFDATGGDGINVSRDRLRGESGPKPGNILSVQSFADVESQGSSRTRIRIIGNEVSESADDGIEVIGPLNDRKRDTFRSRYRDRTNVVIRRNDVENSGDNGIALITTNPFGDYDDDRPSIFFHSPYGNSIMNSRIVDNEVRNSGNNGLHVEGYNHNRVRVSGNTFIDNPTGARFESGKIDLTGTTNNFIVNPDFELPEGFDFVTGMQFELAGEVSDPTSLTIVDETLGTTSFSGFINRSVGSAYYVRFEDGAILTEEGDVIVIDGTQASWDGVVPSSFGNVLPANVLAAIEDRLFDADDPLLNGRGQIFVGTASQGIDNVEDFFNQFGPFNAGLSGLNLRVTGLPSVSPLNIAGIEPFAGDEEVANIEPAAGDEEGGEGVAEIEPAAGGDDAACWGEVLNAAVNGAVNYNFTSDPTESLADAASCGS